MDVILFNKYPWCKHYFISKSQQQQQEQQHDNTYVQTLSCHFNINTNKIKVFLLDQKVIRIHFIYMYMKMDVILPQIHTQHNI